VWWVSWGAITLPVDIARYDTSCHSSQETRAQNTLDDGAGSIPAMDSAIDAKPIPVHRVKHTLPATSSTRILNPRFISCLASCDVVGNPCQARPIARRVVVDAQFDPSFLKLNGIL